MNTEPRPAPPQDAPYFGSWLNADTGVWHPDTPQSVIDETMAVLRGERRFTAPLAATDFAHHPKSDMPETAEELRQPERVWVRGLSIQQFQTQIHDWAVGKGFWEAYDERSDTRWADIFQDTEFVLSKCMLIVSEVAEASEAARKGDFINFKEELADAVIRLFDVADSMDIDLAAEMVAKMKRNEERPYKHGKRA